MSRISQRVVRGRPPAVLVFAEDPTDSASLRELILLHRPDLDGRIQIKKEPASLTREAGEKPILAWIDKIKEVVSATVKGGQRVAAVIVHRDADRIDLQGEEQQRLESQLQSLPSHVLAAVPVAMLESWWLLFPEATESIRPVIWRNLLSRAAGNTDSIQDPKHELMHRTGRSKVRYAEADGPSIAGVIRAGNHKPHGTSPSYDRFVAGAMSLPRVV